VMCGVVGLFLLIPCLVVAEEKSQEDRIKELERKLQGITEEIQKLRSEGVEEQRIQEIERKIDVLAEEIENIKSAAVVQEPTYEMIYGQGPAASKVYLTDKGVSIGGYGEANAQFRENQNNVADMLRAVLYVGYKYNDRIVFNSEIEFEHGNTEENLDDQAGEVAVEFANLNFLINDYANLRAGLNLVPVGIINEVHEPTTFFGVLRPDVERFIIPTTWRELGVGAFGQIIPGLNYRAYVINGLDSRGFTGSEGIREGRGNGNRVRIDDVAFVTRAEYNGIPGLVLGGSFYIGGSGQNESVDGENIDGLVQIYEADAQFQWRGLEARGLFAWIDIGDAGLINENNGFEGDDSVGSELYGFYVEAGYNVLSLVDLSPYLQYFTPFVRFEKYDTQYRVPSGFMRDPANDRRLVTVGLSYKPIPNIVIKMDYQFRDNDADSADNQFNLGLGYVF
ncbi:MAG TPA: hypothetical protein VLB01_03665, partial [Thermodesulfobacteriota bacterium]|nr:hypothetical protein [Thermodesulfobacteriota bacterium]